MRDTETVARRLAHPPPHTFCACCPECAEAWARDLTKRTNRELEARGLRIHAAAHRKENLMETTFDALASYAPAVAKRRAAAGITTADIRTIGGLAPDDCGLKIAAPRDLSAWEPLDSYQLALERRRETGR